MAQRAGPKLESIRFDWELNHYSDHEPDGHMQPLLNSLESLKVELSDDPKLVAEIDKQIDSAQEWIVTKLADDKAESRPPRVLGEVREGDQAPSQERSIFDDIDE
jgi:hypothetical protein